MRKELGIEITHRIISVPGTEISTSYNYIKHSIIRDKKKKHGHGKAVILKGKHPYHLLQCDVGWTSAEEQVENLLSC